VRSSTAEISFLRPGRLLHELPAARDEPTQQPRPLVTEPDTRDEIRGEQLGQRAGIDRVRLHLRLRDRTHLARVREHHLTDVRRDDPRDRERVACRLEHDPIVRAETLREQLQLRRP
jgi:hypothetical protein